MRLYWYGFLMLIKRFLLRQNTGKVICDFAKQMGTVYIKVAQILAMQNVGELFTESDRQQLTSVCDHCNPIPFEDVQQILQSEYGPDFMRHFRSIDEAPLGSASISQVHRAVLTDGTVVALKVKRCDITSRIERDIAQIRRLIHRFGHFVKFRNLFGSDKALEYYLKWIYQETDFVSERRNIIRYQEFADSVNGKIRNISTKITLPKLYPDLCTDNIIVMEFISAPTLNQLPLTSANKTRIMNAQNDYIALSFYALFHNMPVVFHGDPHGGNIYLDESDNLGFLDMGLIFEFSPEEAALTRELFLNAYTGKTDKIVDMLFASSEFEHVDRAQLTCAMHEINSKMHQIPVEQFFVEMMCVFTKHDIAPPEFLFKMAKAFLALFGMNTITGNRVGTQSLLASQVAEFYINRTATDIHYTFLAGLNLIPSLLRVGLRDGLSGGLSEQLALLSSFGDNCQTTLSHCHEMLELFTLGGKSPLA